MSNLPLIMVLMMSRSWETEDNKNENTESLF